MIDIHNAYVMKHGNKVCIVTFMDADRFPENFNHGFVECTTQANIYSNMLPYITVNTSTFVDADKWGEKMDGQKCTGYGLQGIVTRALFYMKRVRGFLGGILYDEKIDPITK